MLAALELTAKDTAWQPRAQGKGTVIHVPAPPGLTYLQNGDSTILNQFSSLANRLDVQIVTTAPKEMIFDLRSSPNGPVLVCANLLGLGAQGLNAYTEQDASFDVSIPDQGKTPVKVSVSEPTAGAVDRDLPFVHQDGMITFDLKVHALMLVRISLQ